MRSSIARAILFICSIGLVILIYTIPIQVASAKPFNWEKIDVDLELVESGDLLVTETQKYVFTGKYTNQRNRYIKIDQIDRLQDIVVTENNQPVANLQISKSGDRQHLVWEHALANKFPEAHTFVLKYRVVGGLEVADPQTKFKWMAIFPDRQAAIQAAQVTLHLPAKLAGTAKNFITNGVAVDTKNIDSTTIQFVTKGSIEPQSYLAILGQFPTDLLTIQKSQWQSSFNLMGWPLFLVYLIIFYLLMVYIQRRFYPIVGWIATILFLGLLPLFMIPWWIVLLLAAGRMIYFPSYYSGGGGWDGSDYSAGGYGGGGNSGGDGGGGGCGGGGDGGGDGGGGCGGCGGGG